MLSFSEHNISPSLTVDDIESATRSAVQDNLVSMLLSVHCQSFKGLSSSSSHSSNCFLIIHSWKSAQHTRLSVYTFRCCSYCLVSLETGSDLRSDTARPGRSLQTCNCCQVCVQMHQGQLRVVCPEQAARTPRQRSGASFQP